VIAGPDRRDATAAAATIPNYLAALNSASSQPLRGLRVGLSPEYMRLTYLDAESGEFRQQPLPSEVQDSVLRAAGRLAEMGADIVEDVPMPHTRYGVPVYFVVSRVEAASNLHRFDGVKYGYRTPDAVDNLTEMYRKSRAQGFGLQPKLRILMGMYVSAAQYSEQYYTRALRVRTLIRGDFVNAFDPQGKYRLQALLTPTTPTTAFPIGDIYGDSVLMQYADQLTVPANHAGVPGISLPAGFDAAGLPIGIQLLGPDFSEATLLRIGRAFEVATEYDSWRRRRPTLLKEVTA
jgi:aspartyl-tRNA(Asn)/glutamyl-tRNA(Gln) amidotransferase subunit A